MDKKLWKFLAFLGLAIILFYLNRLYSRPSLVNEIKIGSILILTGEGAAWGEAARNGAEMAAEEINQLGGVNGKTIKMIFEDDGGDPKRALSAFQKLAAADRAKFILGTSWSLTGLPLVDLAKQNEIVMISPSLGLKEFNEANEYLFNTWPHDYILSEKLAEFVFGEGRRNVAIFGANEVWVSDQTNAFKNKFESLGGKVSLVSEPDPADTDTRTDVLKLKNNKNIDAVILTTNGYGLTALNAKKIQELGLNLPTYSISLDKKIIKECGAACENLIFLTFLTPTDKFIQKYKTQYNQEVEIGADSAYDAIMMLAEAMNKTNSEDPNKIKDYLAGIKVYSGASGRLVSDGMRGFTKPFAKKIIKNALPENYNQ